MLHARIAETLESQFTEIAENRPELLARHCTEAGLVEKAAGLWGKAGQRSLERSALVEAVEQLTRAVGQIASLPATPARRREEISRLHWRELSEAQADGYVVVNCFHATTHEISLVPKARAFAIRIVVKVTTLLTSSTGHRRFRSSPKVQEGSSLHSLWPSWKRLKQVDAGRLRPPLFACKSYGFFCLAI